MSQFIPLAVLDDRIRVVEAELARLGVERDLLRSLRNRAVHVDPATLATAPPKTLTDTVRDYVLDHPGLTGPEVTSAIEATGRVIGGSDPRKTISTTLGALVQKGRLRRDESGRHFAP